MANLDYLLEASSEERQNNLRYLSADEKARLYFEVLRHKADGRMLSSKAYTTELSYLVCLLNDIDMAIGDESYDTLITILRKNFRPEKLREIGVSIAEIVTAKASKDMSSITSSVEIVRKDIKERACKILKSTEPYAEIERAVMD